MIVRAIGKFDWLFDVMMSWWGIVFENFLDVYILIFPLPIAPFNIEETQWLHRQHTLRLPAAEEIWRMHSYLATLRLVRNISPPIPLFFLTPQWGLYNSYFGLGDGCLYSTVQSVSTESRTSILKWHPDLKWNSPQYNCRWMDEKGV